MFYQKIKTALLNIDSVFESNDIVLFHGVTGSGKTEVYMELISNQLRKAIKVLYMLPEISLTPQMVMRLQSRFGKNVTVYHSKFSIHERTEVWYNVSKNSSKATDGCWDSLSNFPSILSIRFDDH